MNDFGEAITSATSLTVDSVPTGTYYVNVYSYGGGRFPRMPAGRSGPCLREAGIGSRRGAGAEQVRSRRTKESNPRTNNDLQ